MDLDELEKALGFSDGDKKDKDEDVDELLSLLNSDDDISLSNGANDNDLDLLLSEQPDELDISNSDLDFLLQEDLQSDIDKQDAINTNNLDQLLNSDESQNDDYSISLEDDSIPSTEPTTSLEDDDLPPPITLEDDGEEDEYELPPAEKRRRTQSEDFLLQEDIDQKDARREELLAKRGAPLVLEDDEDDEDELSEEEALGDFLEDISDNDDDLAAVLDAFNTDSTSSDDDLLGALDALNDENTEDLSAVNTPSDDDLLGALDALNDENTEDLSTDTTPSDDDLLGALDAFNDENAEDLSAVNTPSDDDLLGALDAFNDENAEDLSADTTPSDDDLLGALDAFNDENAEDLSADTTPSDDDLLGALDAFNDENAEDLSTDTTPSDDDLLGALDAFNDENAEDLSTDTTPSDDDLLGALDAFNDENAEDLSADTTPSDDDLLGALDAFNDENAEDLSSDDAPSDDDLLGALDAFNDENAEDLSSDDAPSSTPAPTINATDEPDQPVDPTRQFPLDEEEEGEGDLQNLMEELSSEDLSFASNSFLEEGEHALDALKDLDDDVDDKFADLEEFSFDDDEGGEKPSEEEVVEEVTEGKKKFSLADFFKKFKKEKPEEEATEEPATKPTEDSFFAEDDEAPAKEESKPLDKKTVILMAIVIIILLAMIIVTILFTSNAMKKVNQVALIDQIQKEQAELSKEPQDPGTTLFDMARSVDDEVFILNTVKIDPMETLIYFENNINTDLYKFVLTDNLNNTYNFMPEFTLNPDNPTGSQLKFSKLNDGATRFTLTIYSNQTDEFATFDLPLKTLLDGQSTRYIYDSLINEFDDYRINIDYAEFTNNNTRIDYSILSNDPANYQITHGLIEPNGYVTAEQDNYILNTFGDIPILSNLDSNTIGRIDFESIQDYTNTILLKFDNIYKTYDINRTYTMTELNSGDLVFELDNYTLTVEGLRKFADVYVLVFNAVDNDISTENRTEHFNRLAVTVDAELIFNTGSSNVVVAPTEIRSAQIGTDMLFNIEPSLSNTLSGVGADSISVDLKSMMLKLPSAYVPVNLQRTLDKEITQSNIVDRDLLNIFKRRILGEDLEGLFAEGIAEQTTSLYENLDINTNLEPSIEITYQNLDNNLLEAIVQETIPINNSNGTDDVLYRTHLIKATFENTNWIIVYDEIIS